MGGRLPRARNGSAPLRPNSRTIRPSTGIVRDIRSRVTMRYLSVALSPVADGRCEILDATAGSPLLSAPKDVLTPEALSGGAATKPPATMDRHLAIVGAKITRKRCHTHEACAAIFLGRRNQRLRLREAASSWRRRLRLRPPFTGQNPLKNLFSGEQILARRIRSLTQPAFGRSSQNRSDMAASPSTEADPAYQKGNRPAGCVAAEGVTYSPARADATEFRVFVPRH